MARFYVKLIQASISSFGKRESVEKMCPPDLPGQEPVVCFLNQMGGGLSPLWGTPLVAGDPRSVLVILGSKRKPTAGQAGKQPLIRGS